MNRDEALAWAYLSRVAEPPCPELNALVASDGPIAAAARIRRGDVTKELRKRTEARREVDCGAVDLDVLARLGGRLIVPGDDEWPAAAFTAPVHPDSEKREWLPPLVLWAMGPATPADVTVRSCAVVGTRASTAYGERVTADITAGLVERDMAIVSGAAYGIDGAAHRAASRPRG